MCRYKKWVQVDELTLDGNNGGDQIKITREGEDMIHLWVGHCCVVVLDATVPVAFLTSLISEAMLDSHNDPKALMCKLWPTDYGKQLAEKIKPGGNTNHE